MDWEDTKRLGDCSLTKQLDSIVDYRGKTPEKTEEGTFLVADYITDKVNHIEVEIDKRNKLIKKYQEYKKSSFTKLSQAKRRCSSCLILM